MLLLILEAAVLVANMKVDLPEGRVLRAAEGCVCVAARCAKVFKLVADQKLTQKLAAKQYCSIGI